MTLTTPSARFGGRGGQDANGQGFMIRFIEFADKLSAWFGKAFGWLIILMTLGMSYEVASRYLFNAPTTWSLDVSFIMYGTMFMMGGDRKSVV